MKKLTQKEMVKAHLLKKKSITAWDAIKNYKITRLASVINTLRKEGWKISNKPMEKDQYKFVKYVLVKNKK